MSNGLLRALRAVVGGMIGIRRKQEAERDFGHIKVWQLVVACLLLVIMLVVGLVFLVKSIVG